MASQMTKAEPADLVVPARRVPHPCTISAQAQSTLLLRPTAADAPEPPPSDKEGWRKHVAGKALRVGPQLAQMEQRYPCALAVHALGRASLHQLSPPTLHPATRDCAVLYFHPGGYTQGAGMAGAYMAMPLASNLGMVTFSVDYRMPPDHPYPAALDDALEAYQFLLRDWHPSKIVVAGRSSGGGLAAAAILRARDLGLPMPAACVLQTPQVDLTESGDSFATNKGLDNFLAPLTHAIALYADGHDLRDPGLSPLYGDHSTGFPPTILTSGTRDLFLSNAVLMHRALRRADVEAELHIWEAMGHGGFFGLAPEDEEVWEELRWFVRRHLRPQPHPHWNP